MLWRNPGREARNWDVNTYGETIVDAMGMAREITKSPKINVIGLCAGESCLHGRRAP